MQDILNPNIEYRNSKQIQNWSCGLPTLRAGPQSRILKCSKQKINQEYQAFSVSIIWILVIRNCFGFRASDFEFLTPCSMLHAPCPMP